MEEEEDELIEVFGALRTKNRGEQEVEDPVDRPESYSYLRREKEREGHELRSLHMN